MELRVIEVPSEEYQWELDLRRRVLRWPLGLDFTDDDLSAEISDFHLGAFEEQALVGCLVLTPQGENIKMRQVAIEPSLQGAGIGAALVRFSEDFSRARGFDRMVLHARNTAVPFYLKLDYALEGEPFQEVSIPHRRMVKSLQSGA